MVWECGRPFSWPREASERVHRWAALVALASPLIGVAILVAVLGAA